MALMPDLLNPYSGTHRSERSSLTPPPIHMYILHHPYKWGCCLQITENQQWHHEFPEHTALRMIQVFCIIISIWIVLAIAATACKAHSGESSTLSFVPQNAPSKNTGFQRQYFTRDLGEETLIKA